MLTHRARPAPVVLPLPDSVARRWILFALGASLFLSAQAWARITVAGMLFQPVLALVVVLLMAMGFDALARVPRAVVGWASAFVVMMSVSILVGGSLSLEHLAKLGALWLLVVVVSAAIERFEDGVAAVLGLSLGMGLLSVQTLVFGEQLAGGGGTGRGYNAFEGIANENAFSLYALPAVLLGGALVLDRRCSRWVRWLIAISTGATTVAILSTPNRSGYLGLVVIVVLLLVRGRRLRDTVIIVALGALLYGAFTVYGDSAGIEYEFSERKDAQSDWEKRVDILNRSLDVALINPVLGVGLQNVPTEIGRSMYEQGLIRYPKKDAHSLIGEVAAGGGALGFTALVGWGAALWRRPREWEPLGPPSEDERQARGLLRIMVVLLLARGFFTGAVLTTPGFPLGIGLCVGMMVAARPRPEDADPADEAGDRAPGRPAWAVANRRRLVDFDPWGR